MKIGILTFHQATNYGAVLQCYALQECLKALGNDVKIINYKQPYIHKVCKVIDWNMLYESIIHFHPKVFLHNISKIPRRVFSKSRFDKFRKKHLELTKECNNFNVPQNFDFIIVGSDQVWAVQHTGGPDLVYWGVFCNKRTRLISYAASSNKASLDEIGEDKLQSYIRNFQIISCREKEIAQYIQKATKRKTRTDIDPTLLMGTNFWNKIINKKWENKKYIVLHEARWLKGKEERLKHEATGLAKKENCELVILSHLTYSPEDFVSAIRYARCVITSSFHATAFALIFNRPLIAVKLNDGHDGRYVDLLTSVDAVNAIKSINEKEYDIPIMDYQNVNNMLREYTADSLSYLRSL